jgi:hypothetical protein
MMILARLLYRNLKGYCLLVVFAILVTFSQVGCNLLATRNHAVLRIKIPTG